MHVTTYTVQIDCRCPALGVAFQGAKSSYLGDDAAVARPTWAKGRRKGAGCWTRDEAVAIAKSAVRIFEAFYRNAGRPVPTFKPIIRPATGGMAIDVR